MKNDRVSIVYSDLTLFNLVEVIFFRYKTIPFLLIHFAAECLVNCIDAWKEGRGIHEDRSNSITVENVTKQPINLDTFLERCQKSPVNSFPFLFRNVQCTLTHSLLRGSVEGGLKGFLAIIKLTLHRSLVTFGRNEISRLIPTLFFLLFYLMGPWAEGWE